ncbi:hypothetical protein L3Y34_007497 [Caenorhabditis briggsae]|uniref:Uncharacterized protein n=2 Tax=Caenorhabditis briggsae TaxID=6238 RepID=A0AAE9A6N0_CAEBR|nr:hypothetical protein L3Y34_007497 [Caenorhabditis briggsae]
MRQAWIHPMFLLFLNSIESKVSLTFVSDTSSLFYKSIFIKDEVDEAISTNTSLKFRISSSEPVHFGFLKCGVYSLATTSKIREGSYIFNGLNLKNMDEMINRSCASDSHTESFDIAIHSKVPTKLVLNFESIPNDAMEKSSRNLRSMYPRTVNFEVDAFSSLSYPIQIKSLVRRVLKNNGSVLHVHGSPAEYTMQRCGWEVPGLEVYDRNGAEAIFQLVDVSCENEWLVDTVNIHIKNSGTELISGFLYFNITSTDYNITEIISLQPIPSEPIRPFHVISYKKQSLYSWWMITGFLIGALFLAVVLCRLTWKIYIQLFRSDSYDVAKAERYRMSSVVSYDSGVEVELVRYHSKDESIYSF